MDIDPSSWGRLGGSAERGGKSTALQALLWLCAILTAPVAWGLRYGFGGPEWLQIALGLSWVATVIVGLGSFIYLLVNDRDALRSESFTLGKMAIERGLLGDDRSGMKLTKLLPDASEQGEASSHAPQKGAEP
ncbi:MAG: hypothetical protein JSR73_10075 [Proteobacteria bacterium]|nr:hypothetical protein [Pseudomonadota bacterium]